MADVTAAARRNELGAPDVRTFGEAMRVIRNPGQVRVFGKGGCLGRTGRAIGGAPCWSATGRLGWHRISLSPL